MILDEGSICPFAAQQGNDRQRNNKHQNACISERFQSTDPRKCVSANDLFRHRFNPERYSQDSEHLAINKHEAIMDPGAFDKRGAEESMWKSHPAHSPDSVSIRDLFMRC
jgi:hypothetical protein